MRYRTYKRTIYNPAINAHRRIHSLLFQALVSRIFLSFYEPLQPAHVYYINLKWTC